MHINKNILSPKTMLGYFICASENKMGKESIQNELIRKK